MPPTDLRGLALRRAAALAEDFRADAEQRFENGADLAARDQERLTRLAHQLALQLRQWRSALLSLEASLEYEAPLEQTGRLLTQSVFDETLSPPAARLLAASLDLALTAP